MTEYGPWIQPRLDFEFCQLHELKSPALIKLNFYVIMTDKRESHSLKAGSD